MAAVQDTTITISSPSDLEIKVTEYEVIRGVEIDPETNESRITTSRTPKKSALIHVSRASLVDKNDYFRRMLTGRWSESNSGRITLEEDTIKSMEILLRHVHGNLSEMPFHSVSIAEVWHVIMAADKYGFNLSGFADWFRDWFLWTKEHNVDDLEVTRSLLFPCYSFKYAAGFQMITKELVYENPYHITERNPTSLHQMHLPPRVIQQLNAAKGRLRTILQRGLFNIPTSIIDTAKCGCKEKTVFNYIKELHRIKVRPLEDTLTKTSVDEILDRLLRFNEDNMWPRKASTDANNPSTSGTDESNSQPKQPFERPCSNCNRRWGNIVKEARKKTSEYFDGLCLDCMNSSKNIRPGGDEHDDYWVHDEARGRYDVGCRITHGEPTWYFSFMGRREKKGQFQ